MKKKKYHIELFVNRLCYSHEVDFKEHVAFDIEDGPTFNKLSPTRATH